MNLPIKTQDKIWQDIEKNKEKYEAQESYCKSQGTEIFVYANGECYKCHKNIFDGYSLEECSTKLITCCPFCASSFCD